MKLPIAAPNFAPARAPPELALWAEAVDDVCADDGVDDDFGWPD